jgi:replication factor C small subunit
MTDLWTEKYRPSNFNEIKGQNKIVERIKAFVKQKNIPHCLFAGPAGIGKTTLALIIAKELFKENWQQNFLETNASDERGIQVVRSKIKDFARIKSIATNLPKIIYLDECDALTKEAQQALRRTMELYSSTARFILSCNYSSKIIDPIQSRCAIFRFKSLEKKDVEAVINNIAKNENLTIDNKIVDTLFEISAGDIRRVINILQSCAVINKKITEALIYEIVSSAKPKEVFQILELSINGNFIKARDLLLNVMTNYGLSGLDIIKQIQKEVMNLNTKDEIKAKLIEKCGETEFRLVEGSDEYLQLEALLASFSLTKC